MKTARLFLTIFFLLILRTAMTQDTWWQHTIFYNGDPPNCNSVSWNYIDIFGLICGDSGFIAHQVPGEADYWYPNTSLITNKNLYCIFDLDSSSIAKAYIVGEKGIILKTNSIPHYYGEVPFFFQNSPTTHNLYSVYFTDYHTGIAVGDTGTIIRTTDGGSHWNIISSITQNKLYSVQFPSANIGYSVGVNGVVLKTTDNGQNWTIKSQPIADTLRCVWFTNDNIGYVVSRNGAILKTTDGGNSWQSKPSNTTQNLNAIRFNDINKGYAAGNNNNVLETTNGGETWTSKILSFRSGNYKSISFGVFIVGSNATAIANFPEATSIEENFRKGNSILVPNPAQNKITVNLQGFQNLAGLTLQIYNIQGQLLIQEPLKQNNTEIDISQLPQGVYIAKIKLSDGSFIQKKFIVIK